MKKKISLKLFLTVIGRGICQVFQFIGRIFGYKDESKYAQVIWRVFSGCITALLAIFTLCFCYAFTTKVVYARWLKPNLFPTVYETTNLSSNLVFQQLGGKNTGRIYHRTEQKVLLKDIDWVVTSGAEDSLAVFAQQGKRGYINRHTGHIAIPAIYTKAWVFSEGLAAVEKNGELLFIDTTGKEVIRQQLLVDDGGYLKYAFQHGYCIVKDPLTKKLGLIDKNGQWALAPQYTYIFNNHGFWQVEDNNRVGLLTANLEVMFPMDYNAIFVYDEMIETRKAGHAAKRYNYDGEVVVDFIIDEIKNLVYEKDQLKEGKADEGEISNLKTYGIATCQVYEVGNGTAPDYYGLLDRNGKRITGPIYTQIEAISKDLYFCQPGGIIINNKGKLVSTASN